MSKFIIGIGSQEAGTLLLLKILENCSAVFTHPLRELHYYDTLYNVRNERILKEFSKKMLDRMSEKNFSPKNKREECYLKTNELLYSSPVENFEYQDLFKPCNYENKYLCEITPEYMILPEEGIKKMAEDIGRDAKIILLTRDPTDRFISSVKLLKNYDNKSYDSSNFEDDLIKVLNTMPSWIDIQKKFSDYQCAIDNYSKYFDDILVISYEDLLNDAKSIKTKLEFFLDIELDENKFLELITEYKGSEAIPKQFSASTLKLLEDVNRDYLMFYRTFYGSNLEENSMQVEFISSNKSKVYLNIYEFNQGIVFEPSAEIKLNKSTLCIDGVYIKLEIVQNRVVFLVPHEIFKIINAVTEITIDGLSYSANWRKVFSHALGNVEEFINFEREGDYNKIHHTFFTPHSRKFVQESGYYLLLSFFNQVSKESSSYLGCLSLLAYRYMDSPSKREALFSRVLTERLSCISMSLPTEHHIRWFISSGSTIAVIATALGKLEQAEEVIKGLMVYIGDVERHPIVAMNYYSALLLYTCLRKFSKDDDNELIILTDKIFEGSKKSINDIFNKNHPAILGQITDCKTLLHIGANAITMQQAFTSANPQIWQTSNRFNLKLAFPRFNDSILRSKFFKSFEEMVNNDYLK